jgi:tRNA threonylcarbamoyladenosine biosynthesis protein TsaE
MGAGKTTLIKELCKQLQVTDQAASPTFSIVNEYHSPQGNVYHFDFYRLKEEQEALDLGYEEYFFSGNYCFIEWPEKIPNLLPEEVVSVTIELGEKNERKIRIQKGIPSSHLSELY